MRTSQPTRRDLLKASGALAAGAMLGGFGLTGRGAKLLAADVAGQGTGARKRVLRVAHLTDVHIQPERGAAEGMIQCLHHVQSQADKPDLILNGGDAIMDSLATKSDRVTMLWKLWNDTLKQECSLPVEHCIGNHDIFGWDKERSHATGSEPNFGKKWALEALGLTKPYHSFDRNGWRFIVLDSVHPSEHGTYEGRLDEEQFAWLADILKATPRSTPVLVLSHIPIVAGCVFFHADDHKDSDSEWKIEGGTILLDAARVATLFAAHPNVKVCLSGHMHLLDRLDYNNVSYLCNGAVSGSWWKGKNHECDAGYALVNLYDDGSFDREYIEYGWKARA